MKHNISLKRISPSKFYMTRLKMEIKCGLMSIFLISFVRLTAASKKAGYQKLDKPEPELSKNSTQLVVFVNIKIFNIFDLNQIDSLEELSHTDPSDFSTIKLQVNLLQSWTDTRLIKNCSYDNNLDLPRQIRDSLWTPRIGISAALESDLPRAPTLTTRTSISDDGMVALSDQFIVKISCQQNFAKFPFDSMACIFPVTPTEELPREKMRIKLEVKFLVQHATLATHWFSSYQIGKTQVEVGADLAVDSCTITLKRYAVFYILQAYIPNYLTVAVAWLSFWISPNAIPARVALGISTLVAMVMQYGNILKTIPKVGYLKGIDIWMLGCLIFIDACLIEVAYVSYIQANGSASVNRLRRIDRTARVLHSVCFGVFAAVYFIWSLT